MAITEPRTASKILIVEDDRFTADITRRRVEGLPDVEVFTSDSAADAWIKLKITPFDLILLDINLPDAHGLEWLTQIKRAGFDSAVIFVTGEDSQKTLLDAFHVGVADYVVKTPGYLNELVRVVTRVLRNRSLERRVRELGAISARRAAFLSIVDEVAKAAAKSLEPAEVLAGFVTGFGSALPCSWAALLVPAEDARFGELQVFYRVGAPDRHTPRSGDLLELPGRVAGGSRVPSPDESESVLQFLQRQTGLRLTVPSIVALPQVEDSSLAELILAGVRKADLAEDEIRLLECGATHAHLAIGKALAHQQLKLANDRSIHSEKMRALGVLAAGVAHDFNNRLTVILTSGQILAGNGDNETAELGNFICESAQSAAATVRRIRQYTGTQEIPALAPVNVLHVLQRCREMTRPHWSGANGHPSAQRNFSLECPPDIWALAAEDALMDVLTNLVTNAIQATEPGGHIAIRAYPAGPEVAIEVQDDGMGVKQYDREKILEPFFSTKGVAGQGLGLSVAQGLVQLQEGRLELADNNRPGATFRISLQSSKPALLEAPEATPSAFRKARVLVVDDEVLVGRLVRDALRRIGHSADYSETVSEAFAALRDETYDIVLTDYGMPDMDGVQFAGEIRAKGLTPQVVLLTGWGDQRESLRTNAAVAQVLTKPVTMGALGRMIAETLSASRA